MGAKKPILVAFLALLLTQAGDGAADAQPKGEAYVVIVSTKSPVSTMSSSELRRLYSGQAVMRGGARLIPLAPPLSSSARKGFDRAALKMSPAQVGRFWTDARIRGNVAEPKTIASDKKLVMTVARYKKVVGYLPASKLTPRMASKVRVVLIDGKVPASPGYPLRN